MSSGEHLARFDALESQFRADAQQTADNIFVLVQHYMWGRDKFGVAEFAIMYRRKPAYDIDAQTLDILVQAIHASLCEDYSGGPFDEEIFPSYEVFVGILDKLVEKYA